MLRDFELVLVAIAHVLVQNELEAKGWTYKGNHGPNQAQNGLQSHFIHNLLIRNSFTHGEITQPKELNVRIVSLIALTERNCQLI